MKHPKFIQIVASSTEVACRVFGLTESGEVYMYNPELNSWVVVDANL